MITLESILLLTNAIFGFIEFIVGVRIILKLFGANPLTPFSQWVYETSGPLLRPFQGIFPAPRLSGNFVIEFSALFALLVYALISYMISELVAYLTTRRIVVEKTKKRPS